MSDTMIGNPFDLVRMIWCADDCTTDELEFCINREGFRTLTEAMLTNSSVGVDVGEKQLAIHPLPYGIKVRITSSLFAEVKSRYGKAPRSMKRGLLYYTRHPATGRLIFLRVNSGINEGGHRGATWKYVRVRVPMGRAA